MYFFRGNGNLLVVYEIDVNFRQKMTRSFSAIAHKSGIILWLTYLVKQQVHRFHSK